MLYYAMMAFGRNEAGPRTTFEVNFNNINTYIASIYFSHDDYL